MKKTLALLLALIMMLSVSLVACSNNEGAGNNNDDDDDDFVGISTTAPADEDTDAESNTNVSTKDEWVERNFTAYSMCKMYLRAEASRKAKDIATIDGKTQLTVIAEATITEDGSETVWYKVSYNNQELYANSDYLTTNVDDTNFNMLDEANQFTLKVKAQDNGDKSYVYLRKLPTYDTKLATGNIISVSNEDTATKDITVIGKNDTGTWYVVKYDNVDYYLAITAQTRKVLVGLPAGGSDGDIIGG